MNPFDDPDGQFLVLVNEEFQHSLWPAKIAVPAGWSQAYGAACKDECLQYVEGNWSDLRPRSLILQEEASEH